MKNLSSTFTYKWFNEVWNSHNKSAIANLMAPDVVTHGLAVGSANKGIQNFEDFYDSFSKEFANVHIDIEEVVAEDDYECARTIVTAEHVPSGKTVSFTGMCMIKIKNGKIVEGWNNYDFLNMYEQVGMRLAPMETV